MNSALAGSQEIRYEIRNESEEKKNTHLGLKKEDFSKLNSNTVQKLS